MGKVVKLIMVTSSNNNKFYHMTENDNGTFTVEFGRVGAKGQTSIYPSNLWDKKYNEKVKKGYVDNTELFVVENSNNSSIIEFLQSRTKSVIELVKKLQGWAKGSIERNYTVSSENVTQKQIDKAQSVLDSIVDFKLDNTNINEFNQLLTSFYSIVPRKMKNVKNHLINIDDTDLITAKNNIISNEQETLDVMAGQVKLNAPEVNTDDLKVETDIIENSGLEITEVIDKDIIEKIKSMMQQNSHKFIKAFSVENKNTRDKFNKFVDQSDNKSTELFWHGSRNENWWSIMTAGLMIRPSNAVNLNGAMFGPGIYHADLFQKSFGYTSARNSYWAKGNSDQAVLALYDVHVGNQKHIKKHNSDCYKLNYKQLKSEGFDSVFAHGGADLRNNEYITYTSEQTSIKYLVIVNS